MSSILMKTKMTSSSARKLATRRISLVNRFWRSVVSMMSLGLPSVSKITMRWLPGRLLAAVTCTRAQSQWRPAVLVVPPVATKLLITLTNSATLVAAESVTFKFPSNRRVLSAGKRRACVLQEAMRVYLRERHRGSKNSAMKSVTFFIAVFLSMMLPEESNTQTISTNAASRRWASW
ncbi:hypothetical protein BASA62_005328 [Batrachochytrium salamandrivorans]|nr:hypothetical protein BASA62_005328 [Batrachochytrium salamandrivorans]